MSRELMCKSKFSIRGRDLDPDLFTAKLGITPDMVFRRGDQSFARKSDGTLDFLRVTPYKHAKSLWQKAIDQAFWPKFVPEHLEYWCELLCSHEATFRSSISEGAQITISFYIDWAPIDFCLSPQSMKVLADFKVEVSFGIWPPECFGPESLSEEDFTDLEE